MDQSLGRQDNPIFLITRQLSDIHPDLRASGSGYKAIELALPDYTARLEYLQWYLGQRQSRKKPIVLVDLSVEEMAQLTAGLNLRHLEDILLLGAKDNGVSRTLVKGRKDSIITTEFSEVAEMIEPLPEGFAVLGGMDRLIEWSKNELIAPLRSGRAVDASKGVLLVGPPGTGKTHFVRALSYEIGFNAVALRAENVLGGIVGESERKLKQFFSFARALAPVLIFVDELDQSDMSRRGNTSGNPVAANLFNSMLQFMSDETLRGKVIVVFASNRPDLIDPALLRFGRVDAIVPVLLPGEDARREIALAQVRTQMSEIEPRRQRCCLSRQTSTVPPISPQSSVRPASSAVRQGRAQISQQDPEQALRFIRPATPNIADWYTLLAIQACNDAELLPTEYAQMMMDRAALRSKIKAAQPEESGGLREERTW